MNAIRNLWNALGNLTNAINGLAAVFDTAAGRLRNQLGLDGEPAPVLDHQPAGGEGEHLGSNGTAKRRTSRVGA